MPLATPARRMISLLAVGLAAAAPLAGCEKKQANSETSQTSSAVAEAERSSDHSAATSVMEKRLRELAEKMPSIARLEQALAGAPVNVGITRADRLEHARAWIAEHGGDRTPREAEMQAQVLAMYGELLDADKLSIRQAVGLSESQLLGLWGMDADGDGRLTKEEAQAGMGRMMELEKLTLEYYKDRFDTDGDGTLSPEEEQAGREALTQNQIPLYDSMIERASLIAWDTNADGVLSDAERAEGEAGLTFNDIDGNGEYDWQERISAYQSMLWDMGQAMTLLPQPDPQALQEEIRQEVMLLSESLMPNRDDFDLDGDGLLGEVEQQGFDEAIAEAQHQIQEQSVKIVQEKTASLYAIAQYDIAIDRLDTDGDGRLRDNEWEAGYAKLRGERDQKLFAYLYDADRDGTVTDPEVARFMDSYEKQSPYADANLDGEIDTEDLRVFLDLVSRQ